MKNRFLLILPQLIVTSTSAQNFISGTVVDKESKALIELATVGIVGKVIGSNTNADGKFRLLISEPNKQDTIQFSMIGYETAKIIASDLVDKENKIQLTPMVYSLEEVIVRSKKIVPNDVIKNVINRRERNYDFNPFRLEAYYREIRFVNEKYDHLIEVALNTYGKSVDNYYQEIELLNTRKIDHVNFTHDENLLNSTLRLDYIANAEGFINLSDFKKNNYKFDDIRMTDTENVYIISSGSYPNRKYTLFIDEDTYAIVRLEMEDWYAEREKIYISPIDKNHQFRLRHFKVINIYNHYEGRYYPGYISVLWNYDKYDNTAKSVYECGDWLREFKVNKVFIKNTAKPDPSKIMKKFGVKIDDQMTLYNADFWKSYNLIPLTSKMVVDLESKGALETQFIENGNRAIKNKSNR